MPIAVSTLPTPARRRASLRFASKKRRRERAVALDQERVEAEDLHFLRGLDARAGLAHVVELAPLGRARVVERVALRVEVRLADERRHERDREQHDQPRRVDDEAGGEARDRHDVLRLREELPHQRHAARRLPARALEPVLQLAVLEVLEVERRGVLHQAQAGRVAELLGQQRIEQRHRAPSTSDSTARPNSSASSHADAIEQTRVRATRARSSGALRHLREHDHLVDDQLADVERRDRQQRADQPQHALREGERRVRLPDELEERRQVAQRAEALAQRLRRRSGRRVGGSRGGRAAAHRVVLGHPAIVPGRPERVPAVRRVPPRAMSLRRATPS